MDYREYKTGVSFWLFVIGISAGMGIIAGELFYDAWWGGWLTVPLLPVVYKLTRSYCLKKRRNRLKTEFREVMTLVSGNLNAGYSLENAIVQVHRKNGSAFLLMGPELMTLTNGIACQKRVELLLKDLAQRSGIKEIQEFADMIETAKRYGGNIPHLIRQLTSNMLDAELVETEIQTTVAAKQLEGRIMLLVPFGIVCFLKFTNPGYMRVLYDTLAGRIWMTITLLVIGLCACWIEKIIRIEV